MFFTIVERGFLVPANAKSQVYLILDNWNDYWFLTLFGIIYCDDNMISHKLGHIKIGYFGQKQDERGLKINDSFDSIDKNFFSVGLDIDYYIALNNLGQSIRDKILLGLNDIAKNPQIYDKAINEQVTKISFLRSLSTMTITGQFRRLAFGGARSTNYDFKFGMPRNGQNSPPIILSFYVEPDSTPPTNIHILIGRNGVGKTHLIHNMVNALTKQDSEVNTGEFIADQGTDISLFANLICITFSAFDEFEHPPEKKDKLKNIQYSYIGLKDINADDNSNPPKNPTLLKNEFLKSFDECRRNSKIDRLKATINILESDPIFREGDIIPLIDLAIRERSLRQLSQLFERLSSGHKIVLLTITRLVETIQERSLVLIDEPESHLHPPLLSSFIRALSDLLIDRNAVSIIATHSPVILQEVPKKCVWKLRRSGTEAIAERLEIESFGENVGVLTQEVFGLEVTESGFHSILKKLVVEKPNYESAVSALENNVGLEAKAILRSLFHQKENKNEKNS